jgi:hypothetical protein
MRRSTVVAIVAGPQHGAEFGSACANRLADYGWWLFIGCGIVAVCLLLTEVRMFVSTAGGCTTRHVLRKSSSTGHLVIVSFVMAPILVMALTVTTTFIMATPLIMTATFIMTATLSMIVVAVLALVSRHVFVVIPVVAHEVDPPAAGVVLRAMLAPVVLMPRRHVKVNRRGRNEFRRLPDHHGL